MSTNAPKFHEELDSFFEKNYYSEDFELQAGIQVWRDRLSGLDLEGFDQAILDRLSDDPSILNITICTRLELPSAIPLLVNLLNKEVETSQRSRSIMSALQNYSEEAVFTAIERFMDSSQEREALRILSLINYKRAKPYLFPAMFREGYEDECLHILHSAVKKHGLADVISELKEWGAEKPSRFRKRLKKILRSKPSSYNPFSGEEIRQILGSFPRFG
jgi:hypothetical protein